MRQVRAVEPASFWSHETTFHLPDGWFCEELHASNHGIMRGFHKPAAGKPLIYLSAGIHGDEPAGPLALAALWDEITSNDTFGWIVCPALNPGGLARGSRDTPEGRDMNRDYFSLASPEAKAHRVWLESLPVPDLFVSLHEDWETTGFYVYEINLGEDRPERASSLLNAARPWFAPDDASVIDGHRVRAPGWIDHPAVPDCPGQWPEAIFLAYLGCPLSFTLETPSSAPLPNRVACHQTLIKHILAHPELFLPDRKCPPGQSIHLSGQRGSPCT